MKYVLCPGFKKKKKDQNLRIECEYKMFGKEKNVLLNNSMDHSENHNRN